MRRGKRSLRANGATSSPKRPRARTSAGPSPSARAFTFFPRDCLGWSMWQYLSQSQKGDLFELIACAAENGTGTIPSDHPLLGRLDPLVTKHALVDEGEVVAVVQPLNLPHLLSRRLAWIEGKVRAGEASRDARRARGGTAQPLNTRSSRSEHTFGGDRTSGTERNGTAWKGKENETPKCAVSGCGGEPEEASGGEYRCMAHSQSVAAVARARPWRDPDMGRP